MRKPCAFWRPTYEATLEAVYDGIRTSHLGGSAHADELTAEVIRRVKGKLEVWSVLAKPGGTS